MIYSANMLKTYKTCPLKYKLKYVERFSLPQKFEVFEKGKKIHALAYYYLKGDDITKMETALTPEENAALDTICCHPEICQRDLAKLILKDRANTGRIINSLEKKNLIKRIIDVKNNRLIKKVIITEEGNKKLEEINGKFKAFLENVSCKYTDEEENKLQEAIRTFRKNFQIG